MKKTLLIIVLIFTFILSSFAVNQKDSISKEDTKNLNIKVQVEGKFKDPTINFSEQLPVIDIISEYYINKDRQSDQLLWLLEEYIQEKHFTNETLNKSADLIRINELSIENYNKTIKNSYIILLISLAILSMFLSLVIHLNTNKYTPESNYNNNKIFQIIMAGISQGIILSAVIYLILSIIFNPDIFLIWTI